jgi:hypothetical protein
VEDRNSGFHRAVYVLMGAVVFLLLIGCANLANLQMARVALRSREMADAVAELAENTDGLLIANANDNRAPLHRVDEEIGSVNWFSRPSARSTSHNPSRSQSH